MKTAEEMFKKLGYKSDSMNKVIPSYLRFEFIMKNNENARWVVEFDINYKSYKHYFEITNPIDNKVILSKESFIFLDLHKAITKQMEELGWL